VSLHTLITSVKDDVREARREAREDAAQFRAEISEKFAVVHERVDAAAAATAALAGEIAALKSERVSVRGWIAGALAAVGALAGLASWVWSLLPLALVVALASCAAAPGGPWVSAHWPESSRPVPVYLDASMPEACKLATLRALDTWAVRGVAYLAAKETAHLPTLYETGYIAVSWDPTRHPRSNGKPGYRAGTTHQNQSNGRMVSAFVTLTDCTEEVADHELGHALGLEDLPEEPQYQRFIMYPLTGGGPLVGLELGYIL
jgi:hypothetical protein